MQDSIGKAPEQGYKACASMTRLAERYGAKRLDKACERLLSYTAKPSIWTLTLILRNEQDKLPIAETSEPQKASGPHGITRGAAYFRKGGASK